MSAKLQTCLSFLLTTYSFLCLLITSCLAGLGVGAIHLAGAVGLYLNFLAFLERMT